jgi:hypothetical protein
MQNPFQPPTVTTETAWATTLDVTLRNTGTVDAVIPEADATILWARVLHWCGAGTGGAISITGYYELELPSHLQDPKTVIGKTLKVDLTPRQAVPAGGVDEFHLTIGASDQSESPEMVLFELQLNLIHDGSRSPFGIGRVLVEEAPVPLNHDHSGFFGTDGPADPECVRGNVDVMNEALSLPAMPAPGIAVFGPPLRSRGYLGMR